MNQVARYIYRSLLLYRLKNSIDLFSTLRGTLNHPILIDKPEGSKVLVLSPHQDDDIFGCGGVLHKHHLAGDYIVSVYLTDGRKGGTESESDEQITLKRREEAHKAADIIGINRLVFMDKEDYKDRKSVV